ncbi:FHA domain-containing protein [Leptolyngbya sp. FACHB-17]|uniref:FHA domain-containing protein n=1 Tax=unclassified Leptolyngbya TaxID=2650499 RepID=UPI0016819FD4|nr:FHA domain-containing protein [Leptolyngbya sp. FACHB-17]MBD2080774.1 FHA domain-containing protein [Leptolyngbya sp. FACHB-17]
MIVCPNCNHPNPDGAVQCESCYTPLPATIACPNCSAAIQADASFCGQCGFNLKSMNASMLSTPESSDPQKLPDPVIPDALIEPDLIVLPAQAEAAPASIPQSNSVTQLQQSYARLLNLQTSTEIEIPPSLTVIHIGKPNDRIPPDIDVSGFPNSEIVSRIHADIRVEGDAYYIEDVGSSNGTYINNSPLPMGNRHRLRAGDRISLGKGDKVAFLFQM